MKLEIKSVKDTMINTIGFFVTAWIVVWLISSISRILPFEYEGCKAKWSSFEWKYGFYEGCQIKVGDKWIPAYSYSYKENK